MSNYSFNGALPTMQDALRAMSALSNVCGQPSAEEQKNFVENAHISFKEIDNLDDWKEKKQRHRTWALLCESILRRKESQRQNLLCSEIRRLYVSQKVEFEQVRVDSDC